MLTIVLVVLAVASLWAVVAIAFALLAGGVIHERDHRDAPLRRQRPVVRFATSRPHR